MLSTVATITGFVAIFIVLGLALVGVLGLTSRAHWLLKHEASSEARAWQRARKQLLAPQGDRLFDSGRPAAKGGASSRFELENEDDEWERNAAASSTAAQARRRRRLGLRSINSKNASF